MVHSESFLLHFAHFLNTSLSWFGPLAISLFLLITVYVQGFNAYDVYILEFNNMHIV